VSKQVFLRCQTYGLGFSDFILDGYPDIYVGNDFHEDDYYYLNNGDGTFLKRKAFLGIPVVFYGS
jgi:hypothetical protein